MRFLYLFTEGLRRFGYYYANKGKKKNMQYYWDNSISLYRNTFDKDGFLLRQSIARRLACFILGVLGKNKRNWLRISNFFSSSLFDTESLYLITQKYRHAVVIQTANWGVSRAFFRKFFGKVQV